MSQIEHEQLKEIIRDIVSESHQSIASVQSNMFSEINKNLVHLNGYGKIWKFLRSDLGVILTIVAVFTTVVFPIIGSYFSTQNRFSIIELKLDNVIEESDQHNKVLTSFMTNLNQIDNRVSKIEGIIGKKL